MFRGFFLYMWNSRPSILVLRVVQISENFGLMKCTFLLEAFQILTKMSMNILLKVVFTSARVWISHTNTHTYTQRDTNTHTQRDTLTHIHTHRETLIHIHRETH